jgi:predicted transcriptional regulator
LASFVLFHRDAVKLAPQSSRSRVTPALRDLLGRDPVCREIVQYLMRHNEAADTARGIAEWWINRDIPSTRQALQRLQECGVVQSHVVQGDTFVYAYTKRAVLRQSLARFLHDTVSSPATKEL